MKRLILASMTGAFLLGCSAGNDGGQAFPDAGKAIKTVIETDLGNIHIEVYPDKAPISAKDFLYYIDEGIYQEQGFYRIVNPENDPKRMGMSIVQGGMLDLRPYTALVEHESTETTGFANIKGSVALARNEPGTASAAYFFVNTTDNPFLDFGGNRNSDGQGYAVFGRVTKGMAVLEKMQELKTYSEDTKDQLPPDFPLEPNQTLFNPVFIKKTYRK